MDDYPGGHNYRRPINLLTAEVLLADAREHASSLRSPESRTADGSDDVDGLRAFLQTVIGGNGLPNFTEHVICESALVDIV